jgi:asparagine synthetase B (glutamine-hydrolysing)
MGRLKIDSSSLLHGSRLRARMLSAVSRTVGKKPKMVALLLSAGMDSLVAGLVAHELGHSVHGYTFQLGDEPTFDSRHAATVAAKMGWEHTVIHLPTRLTEVVRAWPVMYRDLHCRKKREFECSWPFLFVYPRVRERYVLNGIMADSHFVMSRKTLKLGASGPDARKEATDAFRRSSFFPLLDEGEKCLTADYNPSCLRQHYLMQHVGGHVSVDPFLNRPVFDYMIRLSWQEMHTPSQKHILAGMYPALIEKLGHRLHRNYQLAGNIDHHFEGILGTPINFRKRGRVIDMMGDWRRYDDEALAVVARIEDRFGRQTLRGFMRGEYRI